MADLGPAIVAVAGTGVGALIAGLTSVMQARSAERVATARMQHERELALAADRSAEQARRGDQERAAITALVERMAERAREMLEGPIPEAERLELITLADLVGDDELSQLARAHLHYLDTQFAPLVTARARYLLRTPPGQRDPS